MNTKVLLIFTLLVAAVSCSKEEPIFKEPSLSSWGEVTKIQTPKGWVDIKPVDKSELPEWLMEIFDKINYGYIMRAGKGDNVLYFVYDNENEYGRFYDAQGNPARDNSKLKDWVVIYNRWRTS